MKYAFILENKYNMKIGSLHIFLFEKYEKTICFDIAIENLFTIKHDKNFLHLLSEYKVYEANYLKSYPKIYLILVYNLLLPSIVYTATLKREPMKS